MTLTADLVVCLLAIAAISAGLFVLGLRIGRSGTRTVSAAIAGLAAVTLVIYAVWLNDNPVLTHLLPVANVLLWGNVQLPAAAMLGGVAFSSLKSPRWQRGSTGWFVIGIGDVARELAVDRPPSGDWAGTLGRRRLSSDVHFLLLRGCRRNAAQH